MGQRRHWRGVQNSFETAKGMHSGTSGVQEIKVRADSDVWGITSILAIVDSREKDRAEGGSSILKGEWKMML